MKKEDAIKQLEYLQKEVDKLKAIIDKPLDILERIFTWEDVCKEDGICPINSLPFKNPNNKIERKINASFKLSKISDVLNENVSLDWLNQTSKKWYNWYKFTGSGWVFDGSDFSYCSSYGQVAFYLTEKKAQHANEYFNKEYLEYLNNQ